MRQKRPIASDKANPRMANEKSWPFKDGLRAYPITRLPKTLPIPAPDPATPTVAAPAPMYLAAWSMSLLTALVWMLRIWLTREGDEVRLALMPLYVASVAVDGWLFTTTVLPRGLRADLESRLRHLAEGWANLAQANIVVIVGC